MREALTLAQRARGRPAPNPAVGAVIVRGKRRIGGRATRPGGAHAETRALRQAGNAARGATLYVTLEPCAHHGNTPPCVEAVLDAGIVRVVIGMRDPDPRTSGRSIRRLRRHGVKVDIGVEEGACRRQHEGFASRIERGRPFTTLKLASSLDGRLATRTGESRWITGEPARKLVHEIRACVDAIAVGSGTQRADDPELSARRGARVVHEPLRIVVDSQLRTAPGSRLIRTAEPDRAWILGTRAAAAGRRERLEAAGARVLLNRARAGHVDLRRAWTRLGSLGVNDLLVEGGGGLAAALLRARLVDRLYWFSAPLLIGGDGRPVLEGLDVARLSQALRPDRVETRLLGDDFLVVGEW